MRIPNKLLNLPQLALIIPQIKPNDNNMKIVIIDLWQNLLMNILINLSILNTRGFDLDMWPIICLILPPKNQNDKLRQIDSLLLDLRKYSIEVPLNHNFLITATVVILDHCIGTSVDIVLIIRFTLRTLLLLLHHLVTQILKSHLEVGIFLGLYLVCCHYDLVSQLIHS
jgi:hypothetical protein